MAHHKSAIKHIKQSESRKLRNRYYHKTVRNAIRKFKQIKDINEAEKEYNRLSSMIDKLAKRKIIHANNASNKKSGLMRYIKYLKEHASPEAGK